MGNKHLYIEVTQNKTKLMYDADHKFVFNTPENVINDGEIVETHKLAASIRNVLSENKLKAKRCSFCLSSSQTIIRQFTVPKLNSESEIRGAIEIKLYETLPDILKTHFMSFKIYEEMDEQISGIVVLVPRDIINSYMVLAGELKMIPETIDISANCAVKYFSRQKHNKHYILVDINYNYINVMLTSQKKILLNKYVINGMNFVDYTLQKQLALAEEEVSACLQGDYKRFDLTEEEFKNFISQGVMELEDIINQFVDFMQYNRKDLILDEILLYGEYAHLRPLCEVIKEMTNIPVNTYMKEEGTHANIIGCTIRE